MNCTNYDPASQDTLETSDDVETVSMDTNTFHQVRKNLLKTRNKHTLCELNKVFFFSFSFFLRDFEGSYQKKGFFNGGKVIGRLRQTQESSVRVGNSKEKVTE